MMIWTTPAGKQVNTTDVSTAFSNLDETIPGNADQLFAAYGYGNHTLGVSEQYECLYVYEHMLETMIGIDGAKYARMHKGTPYYFMCWAAFAIEDYEKAIFYLDAAVSEDIRMTGGSATNTAWHATPAGSFLLLDGSRPGPSAQHLTQNTEAKLVSRLANFSTQSSLNLDRHGFINQFVLPSISDPGFRSIISGLYVFVLEYETRRRQLELRSSEGGSIEPFLTHLFKGGLVFESLLKKIYLGRITGLPTLGSYLRVARNDLVINATSPLYCSPSSPRTFPDLISTYPSWSSDTFQERSIATAYAIRNTTGHDLAWSDRFNLQVYDDLTEHLLNSIFWVVSKVYV